MAINKYRPTNLENESKKYNYDKHKTKKKMLKVYVLNK